jgi:hypothetical protein
MSKLPDIPLSPEAQRLISRLQPLIEESLEAVNKIPVSVLLWGPGIDSDSPLATVRAELRKKLRQNGHAAFYSEELCDPASSYSIRIQQLAQAQRFDLVVSIPCTPGSIAEIHDFASDRRVMAKILVFLNKLYFNGYSPQSLQALSTLISCQLEYYPSEDDTSIIEGITFDAVRRIRELKHLLAGRF